MRVMSEAETKIAEWIWANPNIKSVDLVRMCESNYGWKQSTVYTLIKRMREKEVLINENGRLRMTIDRDGYYHNRTAEFLETQHQGSLVRFLECCLQDGVDKRTAGELMHVIRKYTK